MRLRLPVVLTSLVLAAAGCGEKAEPGAAPPPGRDGAPPTTKPNKTDPPTQPGDDGGRRPGGGDSRTPRRPSAAERARREAKGVARDYVRALDAADGERVCALFVPGALDDLELPAGQGDCARRVSASVGYRDPRGVPQFDGAELTEVVEVDAVGEPIRVTATILTEFADRTEPSLEDDLIYLEPVGGRLRIAQPSSVFYRAIGAEPPPQVISPP